MSHGSKGRIRESNLKQSAVLSDEFVDEGRIVYSVGFTCHVVEGREKATGLRVAIKAICKEKLHLSSEVQQARREVAIHSQLRHAHIAPLLGADETDASLLLITPFAESGDLYAVTKHVTICEVAARNLTSQILSGLEFIHASGLVHCDIKPQNILLFRHQSVLVAQICDFGFAEAVDAKGLVRFSGLRGSARFFSPEQINQEDFGRTVDTFAFGVVLFMLLGGYEPFYPSTNFSLDVEFPDRYFSHISLCAKSFMSSLLILDPYERLTASGGRSHEWMKLHLYENAHMHCATFDHDLCPPPDPSIQFGFVDDIEDINCLSWAHLLDRDDSLLKIESIDLGKPLKVVGGIRTDVCCHAHKGNKDLTPENCPEK